MRKLRMIGAIAGLTLMGAAAAHAAPGYTTADVNLRSGPDTDFPAVVVVPEGEPIQIAGCLDDESWCDVIAGRDRGWMFSEYIAYERRGEYVPLPDVGVAALGIPFVRFAARDYWPRYYVGRPWYRDRGRWFDYRVRARAGWHAPPRGPRSPGWWRRDYRTSGGMRAPPEHWRRSERREGRGERREERFDRRDERRHENRRHWRDGRWRDRH